MAPASVILLAALQCGLLLADKPGLPQVDLGYEVHEALTFNETAGIYTFSNIRYALPPTGERRFAAPVPPTGRNSVVQKGNETRICPQAQEVWGLASHEFGIAYLSGNISQYNYTLERETSFKYKASQLESVLSDTISEDCLFLDVHVPKKIFDRRSSKDDKGAPVFVWLHGGGYVFGHKSDSNDGGDPAGLLKESQSDGSDGIIFVAPNYRLGVFGWLAGPSLNAINGTANVGLHDQRLALDWVQKNIHLFGGDPNQVTLGGLSAGGGSVVHHITAYGGSKKAAPFQRAFLNSPGYMSIDSFFDVENRTQTFLRLANASSLAEARKLPSEVLRRANGEHVLSSDIGFFYGPAVDGDYVPQLPGPSMLRGGLNKEFNGKEIDLLLSYTIHEGGEYNAPWVKTETEFKDFLRNNVMTSIRENVADTIAKMYPGNNPVRTLELLNDYGFRCNNNWLSRAFGNRTYNYMVDIYPGFHGYDVPYTFYGSGQHPIIPVSYPEMAVSLQRYITNFVKTGNPNGKGLPPFPPQGHNASINVMRKDGWATERDRTVGFKCEWLQKALFV